MHGNVLITIDSIKNLHLKIGYSNYFSRRDDFSAYFKELPAL